ncbi:helix-turn-helix domain-containing protein [Nocardia cyriacigeorgica]|uniref:helix-turn-helix domain-containing protein n=3 Tax=Nocardia cyriacigeorgica TaxID=135487 RepID=UPI0002F525DB|nr:helix-turn-helix transcriptional regulator [Nocardia cyriacigeorgica]AVH24106.1 XRE family transcriptional regulator [Nocardia cyriacigeorgica]MBF6326363.1 helix-turn-helix domain-containing protein [Nocardia cyriacigeorgica]MBF6499179.1 helix-turn-helix domain-containing protein [Nocardia cyriacigeorgica]PPJ05558.1 XRE family transcriptional regulator [Nocardia cyriacigeorgica]TLF59866.1 helix-turn-helix domain-containing protein [Nocardia cyriacigeorgica]
MTNAGDARRDLGARLRGLRVAAHLRGYQLAEQAGWHPAKVSRIENGAQSTSEDDLAIWCRITGAEDEYPDLLATLRNISAAWTEWRRIVGLGYTNHQRQISGIEERTELLRGYDPQVFHGLLQTADYARALMGAGMAFLNTSRDLDQAVAARMDRQRVLHQGRHRFYLLVGEQALRTTVGGDEVMAVQLTHLLEVMSLPRLVFGIVPASSAFFRRTTDFVIYDRRKVLVETITAESTITQPREIALYEKVFTALAEQAVHGDAARELIAAELVRRTGSPRN